MGRLPTYGNRWTNVLYGTLALLILKTLDAMGPLHGYALARPIEQISQDQIVLNQGTLYPALRKLQHAGWISSRAGETDTGRQAKCYAMARYGLYAAWGQSRKLGPRSDSRGEDGPRDVMRALLTRLVDVVRRRKLIAGWMAISPFTSTWRPPRWRQPA